MLTLQGLKVAWLVVKKWAWLLFAVVAGVLAMLLLRRSPTDLADQLDDITRRHEEEIRKVKEAEELRTREREESQKRLDEALKALDDRYRKAISQLDQDKAAEVDRVLKEHGGDPAALAEELARVLGLQVERETLEQ